MTNKNDLRKIMRERKRQFTGEKLGEICAPPPFEEGMPPHLHWEIRLDGEAIDAAAYGFDS